MAISWDTSGCSVPLPRDDSERQQRDTLIFLASQVDCGDLSLETLQEWAVRVVLLERLCEMQSVFGGAAGLCQALKRWCGMTTNCRYVSRDAWLKERLASVAEVAEHQVSTALEEASVFAPIGSCGVA